MCVYTNIYMYIYTYIYSTRGISIGLELKFQWKNLGMLGHRKPF